MKILITGASGFVGGRLAERLATAGHHVVGTGRGKTAPDHGHGQCVPADLLNPEDCQKLCSGVDAVAHCAGKADVWGPFAEFERANVTSTRNLLDAARKAGVGRFINISSPSIYFDYRHQLSLKEEDLPRRFVNAYASTKHAAERLVSEAHRRDFLTVSLRPRGVIGAGDRNWLPRILDMRRRGALIQPGDGKNIVDFATIGNLLDAVELCLTAQAGAMGRTYNISNGTPEYLWDVITSSLEAVGLDGKSRRVPLNIAMMAARLSEIQARLRRVDEEPALLPIKVGVAAYSMTLDISAAKAGLGYDPRLTTEQGVSEFAHWWTAAQSPQAKRV
jgi:2-alkyl-3-oxoalkanoate reductase